MKQVESNSQFILRAQARGAAYLLAPTLAANPLANLGSASGLAAASLKNGAALVAPGMFPDGAAANLDGINDYIESGWATRKNLIANPSFEVGTSSWATSFGSWASGALTRVASGFYGAGGGSFAGRILATKDATAEPRTGYLVTGFTAADYAAVVAGRAYSLALPINVIDPPATGVRVYIEWLTEAFAGNGISAVTAFQNTPGERIHVLNNQVAPAGSAFAKINVQMQSSVSGDTIDLLVDSVLMEEGATTGVYFPTATDLKTGAAGWTGSEHKTPAQIGPFANGTARTFVGLATRPNTGTAMALMGSSNAAAGEWVRLTIAKETRNVFFTVNGGTNQVEWPNAWPVINTTAMWSLVVDEVNNTAELYINGVSQGVKAVAQQYGNLPGTLQIGATRSGIEPWAGKSLPFSMFYRALDAIEVKELFEYYSKVAVTRELPPSKLALRIGPRGAGARWAEDEPAAENVLSDIELSDEMPGGYKELSGTLGRNPQLNWADLIAFGDAYAYLPGVQKVWQGSIDKTPDVSGEQMSITPALLGYQAVLEDNQAAQFGGIHADVSAWGDPTLERRKQLIESNIQLVASVATGLSSLDPSGTSPGVIFDFTNVEAPAATYNQAGEAHFYGDGIDIGKVLYDYRQITSFAEEALWESNLALGSTDRYPSAQVSADYNRATHLVQTLIANQAGYKWARVRDMRAPNGALSPLADLTAWQNIRVLGRHGIEPEGAWPNIGLKSKSMLEYVINNLASPLYTDSEYIDDDGYIVPHAWYGDMGAVADIVKDILKYGLYDWFVYTGKRFDLRKPGSYGKYWKAYVGPSQLNEVGVDSQRLWRSIVVSYQDVDGSTRTVGPIGSGATVETSELEITDPEHPAVKAERTRKDILDLQGIGVPSTAIAVGKRFLEEANLINRSGSATLQGYVMDQYGVFWPAACVKSGDWISFVDAADRSYRKIIGKTYRHSEKSAEIDLDAPASGLEALLERLQAGLISLGVN